MSQHRSLKSTAKDKKQRSVLGRLEQLKILKEKGEWKEGDSAFGLPKVKVLRLKLKKEKPKEKEVEEKKVEETQGQQPETQGSEKKQQGDKEKKK